MKSLIFASTVLLLAALSAISCRKEEPITASTEGKVTEEVADCRIKGFFLLNEGNMGSNKATLDYFDYSSGVYTKNIFPERNPQLAHELGDVGNDLAIYGSKLYAVINCSHLVEVMDVNTARHITQISIPNCRYIVFDGPYAYVSSYAGPVQIDPNARRGYVARIDTLTMAVIDTCVVGYQPEQMAVCKGKLYVANSGGYMVPNYDRTVSVIDLKSFSLLRTIDVAINLHRMEVDRKGHLWVSSRGDYYQTPSKTYVIDTDTDSVIDSLALPNSEMTLCGDSLYVYSSQWSYSSGQNSCSYALVDIAQRRVVADSFITDGTDRQIKIPYGVAVNPETHEIIVTDAKNYVTPGTLYCFRADGTLKWSVTTGDIPAHIAFTHRALQSAE